MTNQLTLRQQVSWQGVSQAHQCFCVGPQQGQSKCPCELRMNDREKIAKTIKGEKS